MGASFKKPQGKTVEPIPEGTYAARCYAVVELGTQEKEWKGEIKHSPELMLFFEIPELTMTYEKDGETIEKPRVINGRFTNSMGDKAKLRAFLQAWRGKKFTDEEAYSFDVSKVLGHVAQISVEHNAKGYANISSIAPLMKGITVPPQVNPTVNFGIDDIGSPVFGELYPWVQDAIKKSAEWLAHLGGDLPGSETKAVEVEEDDIPF